MDTAIVVAVIALVASVVSAAVSLFGDVLLATWKSRRDVRSALATYRETLAGAAYELQARLFTMVRLDFLQRYYVGGEETERQYAIQNTLYVIAQYLAWVEALRREVGLGRFGEFRDQVARRLDEVGRLFGSDNPDLGRAFRVWRGEQQAIGAVMLSFENGQTRCLSYADFVEHSEIGFRRWFVRLERDIEESIAGTWGQRLRLIQNELVDLVRELDKSGQYSQAPLAKL